MFVYFHGSLSAKHKSGHCHRGLWSVGGFWVLVKPATRVQNQKILSGGKHFPRRVGGNCTKIWKAYQHACPACPLGTGRLQQTNSVPFSLNKKRKASSSPTRTVMAEGTELSGKLNLGELENCHHGKNEINYIFISSLCAKHHSFRTNLFTVLSTAWLM